MTSTEQPPTAQPLTGVMPTACAGKGRAVALLGLMTFGNELARINVSTEEDNTHG